ncbi:hypothetical protein HDU92_007422 [Lobulomyces angularis]|nr:hypothetical protein HDU92_007422 [Lobulomyces angularis]
MGLRRHVVVKSKNKIYKWYNHIDSYAVALGAISKIIDSKLLSCYSVEWVYVIDTKKKRFRALCGLYDQSIAWKVLKSPKIWSKETEKEVQRQEIENYFL